MFSDPHENIDKLDLEHGMKVVDVGAGAGHHTILIAKKVGPSGKVYAVDVQKDLLARLKNEAASEHLHNVDIILADIEKLGGTRLKDGIADRVFISNVLFQIEDQENCIKELRRLLHDEGKLLLIDWARPIDPLGGHAKMVVGPLEAAHLFEAHGFKKLEEFDAGDHHYGMLFIKKNH